MPSTRRSVLVAALAAAAGCTGGPADDADATPTGSTTTLPGTTTTVPSTTTDATTDAPAFARWSHDTGHDALGTLTLAPGAGGPAVLAGSAAADGGEEATGDDPSHSLLALSLPDGSEQWRASLPDPVQFEPRYGGDDSPRLYVATGRVSLHGEGSRLHALDPTTGERAWGFDTEARRFLLPLAATDDAVLVGRRDDQRAPTGESVYCLDAADGGERWEVGSGDARRHGSAVRRGTALLRSYGRLQAVDPATGDRRWQYRAERHLDGPAYDSRGRRVVVGDDGDVLALDLRDGSEVWRREFGFTVSAVTTPLAAMSATVFVGDYGGRVLALSPLDGETRWTYGVDAEQFYPQVERTSETLFLGGAGVHALDPVSGERKWSFVPDVAGTVGVDVGTTAFASGGHDDSVWALDPETGEVRWRFAPGGEVVGPVVAGDFAFVGVDGTVHALDGSRVA